MKFLSINNLITSISLKQRHSRVFIVPNKWGFLFIFGVFLLIILSVLYNNNVSYIVSFTLVAVMLLSMILTHFNLQRLSFSTHTRKLHGNALENINIKIQVEELDGKPHYDLNFACPASKEPIFTNCFVESGHTYTSVQANYLSPGVHVIDRVLIKTSYPFGLF